MSLHKLHRFVKVCVCVNVSVSQCVFMWVPVLSSRTAPHTFNQSHFYTHIHLNSHTHTQTLSHTHTHIHTHTHTHTHTHIHTYTHTHIHTHSHTHTRVLAAARCSDQAASQGPVHRRSWGASIFVHALSPVGGHPRHTGGAAQVRKCVCVCVCVCVFADNFAQTTCCGLPFAKRSWCISDFCVSQADVLLITLIFNEVDRRVSQGRELQTNCLWCRSQFVWKHTCF
jgi:hypothetical protein